MIEVIEQFEPLWLAMAKTELGQAEIPGSNDNPRILEYHKTTTLKASDDEIAWCSSYVNWCMMKAGQIGTGSAQARSWLSWGKEIKIPTYGCVVIMSRADRHQGHVGFYMGRKPDDVIAILGGNQGNTVSVAWFSIQKVLGYRWPA